MTLNWYFSAESDWATGQDFEDDEKPFSTIAKTGDSYDWLTEAHDATAVPLCSLPMNESIFFY